MLHIITTTPPTSLFSTLAYVSSERRSVVQWRLSPVSNVTSQIKHMLASVVDCLRLLPECMLLLDLCIPDCRYQQIL